MIRYKTMSQNPHLDLAGLVALLRADAGQLYRLKQYDDLERAQVLRNELRARFHDLEVSVTSGGILEARAVPPTPTQQMHQAFRAIAEAASRLPKVTVKDFGLVN